MKITYNLDFDADKVLLKKQPHSSITGCLWLFPNQKAM